MKSARLAVFVMLVLVTGRVFALYDPVPDPVLAGVQGEWRGSLTYRDYSRPDKLVTLPTTVFVALAAPDELVLHFIFDDGPSKKVFSYDRMKFDLTVRTLSWASGPADKPPQVHDVTSVVTDGTSRDMVFERPDGEKKARFTLLLSPVKLQLKKEEISSTGEITFRNRYEFVRPGP